MKRTLVHRIVTPVVCAVTVCALGACPAIAQTASQSPAPETAATAASAPAEAPSRGWAIRFVRDVGGDYVHFFSKENAIWLGVGGAAALAVHAADDDLSEWAQENNP